MAEFETGFVSNMGQRTPVSSGDASLYFGMPEYAAFVEDSWNATRNLTVDTGTALRPADSRLFREQLLGRARPDLSRVANGDAGIDAGHLTLIPSPRTRKILRPALGWPIDSEIRR